MNSMFFATLFCMAAFASAAWVGAHDGQWRGEGLAESQDLGQWNYGGNYAYIYGPAPIGADGRVIDTPEVALAKSSHFAAIAAASQGAPVAYTAWGPAVYGVPQVPQDTPEVAQAKVQHFAAHAAAANRW